MSFGGAVQAMITTMKNNSRSRKRSYFDKKHSNSNESRRNPLLDKKATPEQLAEIKERIMAENHSIKQRFLLIVSN